MKITTILILWIFASLAWASSPKRIAKNSSARSPISLDILLEEAFSNNINLKAVKESVRAEKKLITSKYNLSSPSIGLSRLKRGNDTKYFQVQQKIKFPTKYFLEGKAQKRMYEASKFQFYGEGLKVRKRLIGVYYDLYSIQKTIQLTKVNLELIKDFSRIAERKYASGKASRADSMKAHFESTHLELQLLQFEQEEVSLQAQLSEVLGRKRGARFSLVGLNLKAPKIFLHKIKTTQKKIREQVEKTSPDLLAQMKQKESLRVKAKLAKWNFAPDFSLKYQKRISGTPEDSSIFSINASIPLWFWKNSADSSYAAARAMSASYKTESLSLKLSEDIRGLKQRLEKAAEALLIYKTSLMPQADGAYRSSRSAYKAGAMTFLDLLDAERSLYSVKQAYYKSLSLFVKDIVKAETILGFPISNLHNFKGVLK